MSSQEKIRIAVVGVGAFGRNHARVLAELQKQGGPVELAGVCDADPERAAELAMEFKTQAFTALPQLIQKGKIHAACVAVPTVHHLEVAKTLMEAGVDVLIEKPLATALAEADDLIRVAHSKQRVAMVGHLERFNPAVRATAGLITQPMFFEVHRLSLFSPRALDVDVVLDLMIHDIDIVLSLVKSPVKEVRAVGLPILSPRVDIGNVRLEFDSGCVANLTASRVSTERVRKLRFFQPRQYVSVDYAKQDVFAITVAPAILAGGASPEQLAAAASLPGALPIPGVRLERLEVVKEEPLRAELRAFLEAVHTRKTPEISLEDGRRALAVALDITRAMAEHHRRADLDHITQIRT
ncbi:MAG: Gfo/Idh/MocA family oxidoreductase [Acidobacteriales bacterium]|nr:Gfo/Idh/MocA family oxidoreductase [Terriglobales bacterium]